VTSTYMGGRRGPPEGDERPLRGLPGGRDRPRAPEGPADPDGRRPSADGDDGDRPRRLVPVDGDGARPGHGAPGKVARPRRPLRVIPGGAGRPLRVLPGGAHAPPEPPGGVQAPPELPDRDGQAPDGDPRAAPQRPVTGRPRTGSRRRWVAGVLALAMLAGLAVTGRVLAERPQAGPATTTPATATTPPPTTAARPSPVTATIGLGGFAYGIAAGAGALWVAGSDDVTRIDPASNSAVATIPVGATGSGPAAVAFGAGAVWVPVAVPGSLWAIDPATDKVTARISLGGPLRGSISVSATRGAVWVAASGGTGTGDASTGGTLFRIDPRRKRVVAEIPLPAEPVALAAEPSAVWVATSSGRVLQLRPKDNRVLGGVDAGGPLGFNQTIAVGAGAVWLADPFDEQVVRIDPESRQVLARIPAGAATTLAATGDAVWVVSSIGLLRVDPAKDRVVASTSDPGLRRTRLVAAGAGAVWTAGWSTIARIDPDLVAP
jgi:DNA-binding beta-propeller fold protein YncE